MVYVSTEDFLQKVEGCTVLSRQEELVCAAEAKQGSAAARERLIQSYLPMVAGRIKHMPSHLQSLGLVYYCLQALERAVDTFDFTQNSEPFTHRLNWALRQAVTRYIVR